MTTPAKEIYLKIGTGGAEKSTQDLKQVNAEAAKVEGTAKKAGGGLSGLSGAAKELGKVKETVNQNLERFNFLVNGATLLAGGALVGALGGAIQAVIGLVEAFRNSNKAFEEQVLRLPEFRRAMEREAIEACKELTREAQAAYEAVQKATSAAAATAAFQGKNASQIAQAAQDARDVTILRQQIEKDAQELAALQGNAAEGVIENLEQRIKSRLDSIRRITQEDPFAEFRKKQEDAARKDAQKKKAGGGKADYRNDPFLRALVADTEAERELLADQQKQREDALKQAEGPVKRLQDQQRKQIEAEIAAQDARTKLANQRFLERGALQAKAALEEGRAAGTKGGAFALIGETDAARIVGIKAAIREGIIDPAQAAYEATQQLAQGLADAGAAAILEGRGFKAASNEVLKGLARQALARSLFEGAAALASLAMFDPGSALLHAKAAAAFALVTGLAAAGASATGGLRSGSGGGSAGAGAARSSGAPTAATSGNGGGNVFNMNFQIDMRRDGTRGGASEAEDIVRTINRALTRPGALKLDPRAVGSR